MSKKIIVTGCNGQLGRAINKAYAGDADIELINADVVGDGVAHVDITDIDKVLAFAREVKPWAIINCAAYTNVDKCEIEKDLAFKINAIGPRNLAIAATETGAKLMHVSTDYVFPGTEDKALTEFDPVGPISGYGITKLAGENFVKQFANKLFTVRTAWLYGDGHNFVKTMLKAAETREEVSVVCDQFGSPTSADELASVIRYLLPTDNYGLFHGTCEGSCSWADFTDEIYRLAGLSTKVNHITTAQYQEMVPGAAHRPAFSVLDNYMLRLTTDYRYAQWQDAIAVYMKELMG